MRRVHSASGARWGWITLIAIVVGLLGLMLVPNAFPMHGNDTYGVMLAGGLASLMGGIVAAWAAWRYRRSSASRVSRSLASAAGGATGVMLLVSGGVLTAQALDGLWRPPWCRNQSAAMALGALRAANSGISTILSTTSRLPRRETLSDWEDWVPRDLAMALADPTVAFDGTHRLAYTPVGGSTDGYSIVARPVTYGYSVCSVYTDESGVVRYTTEDRPATAQDRDVLERRRWGFFPR